MTFGEAWRRSALSASAVHEIRNRLQNLLVEVALLRRAAATDDPAAKNRAGTLVDEAAELLELFPQLLATPDLRGIAALGDVRRLFDEHGVAAPARLWATRVGCRPEALTLFFAVLFAEALPERGFRPANAALGEVGPSRVGFTLALRPATAPRAGRRPTAWMLASQLARELGGSLALAEGDQPSLNVTLSAAE